MTISSAVRTAGPYTGNSLTTVFPFSFKVFATTDLVVLLANGVTETTLVLNSGYTVTLNPDQNASPGGVVTTLGTPLTVSQTLTLTTDLDEVQGTALTNQGGFYPKVIENALDRIVILIQQIATTVQRSIRFPLSDTGVNTELPVRSARANNLLGFDANGNPIAVAPSAQSATALQTLLATPSGASLVGFLQSGTGAIARTTQAELRDALNVKQFGALGNGSADDTAAIILADTESRASGRPLVFPAGAYMASQLPIKSGCRWIGAGRDKTIFKQIIGSNKDFLLGDGAAAAWGTTSPTTYVDGYHLESFTVDGNWNAGAGNTSGSGIAVWGSRPIMRDVFITNVAEYGLRTEWSDVGPLRFGMEGHFDNIRVDVVGKHGWLNNGPHDSTVSDFIVIDAGQAATNTYDGILLDTKSNIRAFGLHVWNRSSAAARHRFAINDQGGGNEISGSHFEGAWSANVNAAGPLSSYEGCNMYAAWNGVNVLIRNTGVTIRGKLGAPGAGRPNCKGIVLGMPADNASSCLIDVVAFNQNAGVMDFTNEPGSGFNTVRVRGYSDLGATFYVGSPSTQDNIDVSVSIAGAANGFRQNSGTTFQRADIRFNAGGAAIVETISGSITAAGATQGTATALAPNTIHPVNVVAASTGVILPDSTSFLTGKSCMVCNFGANTLLVYPEVGSQLGTLATNAPASVGSGKKAHFTRTTTTQWAYTLSA